jgi:class 3 adenylate cyclase/pimeloyl-ACP methyl ester carboxylesterase
VEPSIHFCTSKDGTRLAYATLGEGRPLLHVPGFSMSAELEWKDPEARAWMLRVAAERKLVRCDRRGTGASQRQVGVITLEAQVDDLAAVVEQLRVDSVDIFAAYDAVVPALAYTVSNPDAVGHLVLFGAFVRGLDANNAESYDALAGLARQDWRLFLRTWASLGFPSGPVERQRWYARLVDATLNAEVAAAYLEFMRGADFSDALHQVRTPCLVLHRERDAYSPPASGRFVAASLPNASFVPLEGDIGIPVVGDSSYLERVHAFLRDGAHRAADDAAEPASAFRTVLFTDLVGHTEMMQRLGDERGREVLREHERITRDLLKQYGGAEVKTMGDGFMASFASVTKAMDCAIALQRAISSVQLPDSSLQIRVGLNAGEPIEEDGDLFGATVILASRIAAKADAGEIIIPEPLRHLLAGKSYVYADRGDAMLKGFEDAVRLYEVRWRE